MRVTIRLFARLRDLAGAGEWSEDVDGGDAAAPVAVADVWRAVVARHPDLAPLGRAVSCAVNAEFARMDARVADGDEVAFLPPVSGGYASERAGASEPRERSGALGSPRVSAKRGPGGQAPRRNR